MKEAASKQIQCITRPDRKDLSQYLSNPEAKPPASIDLTAPVPVPIHLSRSGAGGAGAGGGGVVGGGAEEADPAATAKERERLERILDSSLRPGAASDAAIRPLSDALTADKIKELKTKALTRKRAQIQSTAEDDVGAAAPAALADLEPPGKGRERVWRTRTTCLEASTKVTSTTISHCLTTTSLSGQMPFENFAKSVFPILQALKHREEGRAKQPEVKQVLSTIINQ